MSKQNLTLSAIFIAVSIVLLGWFLKSGIDHFSDRDRVVTVRGLCEKEVKADKVTWPIVTKDMGNDLNALYTKITDTNNSVLNFLKSNGIEDSEIMVNPPEVTDKLANAYSQENIKYRYNVTNVIVVTSSKIDKINQLMLRQTDLLKQGVAVVAGDYQYQTAYEFTGLNGIKPEMIAEATQNARTAAEKFADDSHSDLGKIQSATQGQFSIEDRDQYTPSIKTVRVITYLTYYLND